MRKVNIPMVLACVLLLLTMVSVHLTSGLYARYTTTAAASDSARVAKFDVRGSAVAGLELDCQTTTTGEYIVTVENHSEVSVNYILYVTMSANPKVVGTDFNGIMTDVEYMDNNSEGTVKVYADSFAFPDGTGLKFTRDTPLTPGMKREHHIAVTPYWNAITGKNEYKNVESVDWEITITARIEVKQVD